MTAELEQLRAIINTSLDHVIAACTRRRQRFPSLNDPADAFEKSLTSIRNDPEIQAATPLAVAAASQLIATLQSPTLTLLTSAAKFNLSACIGAAERTHVAEILREGDPQGMHVAEITRRNGTYSPKLARVLRYLATNHIFREVSPNIFAHNLVSSLLDSGKSVAAILEDPGSKFDGNSGMTAMVSMMSVDCMKAAAYLPETLSDPKAAFSQEPTDASFQKAFGCEGSRWEFLDQAENAIAAKRYAAAMAGSAKMQPLHAVIQGFDWASLPSGAVVVDVGGNIGNITLEIAKTRPDLQFVVEDRPLVIEKASAFWNDAALDMLASGKVKLAAVNFFEPQPPLPGAPAIFLLRAILHDWSDKYAAVILQHLRDAAKDHTKLLIIDTLVRYACPLKDDSAGPQIPGYEPVEAPQPLLPNFGSAGILAYDFDIVMLNNLNASERTLGALHKLLAQAGWRITEVRHDAENKMWWPIVVAVPQ